MSLVFGRASGISLRSQTVYASLRGFFFCWSCQATFGHGESRNSDIQFKHGRCHACFQKFQRRGQMKSRYGMLGLNFVYFVAGSKNWSPDYQAHSSISPLSKKIGLSYIGLGIAKTIHLDKLEQSRRQGTVFNILSVTGVSYHPSRNLQQIKSNLLHGMVHILSRSGSVTVSILLL